MHKPFLTHILDVQVHLWRGNVYRLEQDTNPHALAAHGASAVEPRTATATGGLAAHCTDGEHSHGQ